MKSQKYSVAAGIVLFILAALFSISLLSVAADFGGISPAQNSIFHSLGKMLTGVYGLTSVCIPLFLIVAGIQCFMAKWRIRNGVLLLGSIIPFFTLDAVEHICRMFLNSESDTVLFVKFSSTLLIGALVLAAEYLLLSILGDVLENSFAEAREYYRETLPAEEDTAEESEEISLYGDDSSKDEEAAATTEEKIDFSHDKIFLEQKEVLKDLINDGKTENTEESEEKTENTTVSEDTTILPEETGESNEPILIDEPTIIEHEEFDESETIPESVEEEEILDEEDFAEADDDETISSEETEENTEVASPFEHIFDTQENANEEATAFENEDEENSDDGLIEDVALPDFEESAEDEELVSEINKVFGADSEPIISEEAPAGEDAPVEEISFEEENFAAETDNEEIPVEEETPIEEDIPFDADDFQDETETSFDDDDFQDEEEISVNAEDFQNEDDDLTDARPVEFKENPADFINIEDISEEADESEEDDEETDEAMGIDDIFSEMDEDAAANPVFKPQDAPTAHDSLYQGEPALGEETESDDDFDDEDRSLSEVDGIDFEEEVDAPDVVSADEVEAAEKAQEKAKLTQIEEEKQKNYRKLSEYKIPTDLLEKFENDEYWRIDDETKAAGENLKQTLNEFGIEAEVTGIRKGPVVTMFELLPAPGVKLSKIVNLQDNIALSLAAKSVRIVAPIPGRHAVGIEIPNKERAIVSFREIIEQNLPEYKKMAIPVILGKDISGQSQIIDIAKTPHLLIAGATGAGKSVCVNSIILSILYNRSPNDVKLIMVDPKVVELKLYNDIPHLLTPVVTEPKRALQVLQYCICEMERRYALLDGMGVRDIVSYNTRIRERKIATEKLPYIVVIIDEFADLMATSGKELETNVARLTAMSRAVGIHLVLATQRPSVNVITGLIKANIPSRIAFMVASRTDSNIIIDAVGAEKLLGKGDMLYTSAVNPIPTRIQGTLVGDNEVERVVEYVKSFGGPDYIDDEIFVDDDEEEDDEPGLFSDGEDPLYDQALQIVVQTGKASASYLQRRLKIGYNRAARLVEDMEQRGIVGPANGSKPREVIHVP